MGDIIGTIIVIVVTIGGIWYFFSSKYSRIKKNWDKLCKKYHFKLEAPSALWKWASGDRPYASGKIGKYEVRCDTMQFGSTEMNTYTRAQFPLFIHGKQELSFYRAGLLSKVERALGGQDIKMGNQDFDDAFMVKSDEDAFAKRVLTPKIQQMLLDKCPEQAFFWIAKGKFKFEISHNDMKTDQDYEDCVNSLEISHLVAQEIEKEDLPA